VQLVQFIQEIIQQGKVTVAGEIIPFSEEDLQQSIERLREYHYYQVPELTGMVPSFNAPAALWAAGYLYRVVQLVMLRNLGEDAVQGLLIPYDGPVSPEAVLSVDVSFRYLPNLLALAKGLAPEDVLVKRLQETAAQWPFSSVGMKVNGVMDVEVIMNNACLRKAYIDRIIEAKDRKRCNNSLVNEYIKEALGDHGAILWPGWEPDLKEL
jgi:hypothetical protein